jgi:hypothetical protein
LFSQPILIIPTALRLIHRQIRNMNQPVHARRMVREHRDPQAGADVPLIIADSHWWRQFDEDFLADAAGFVLQAVALGQALKDDHKLVATDPGDGIG